MSVEFTMATEQTFNIAMLQEYVQQGQRIERFSLSAWVDGDWRLLRESTTVGYKRLLGFEPVTSNRVRINIPNPSFS